MRTKTRAFLTSFVQKANDAGLKLSAEYVYTTNDGGKLNSRPKSHYTYTVILKIAPSDEADNAQTTCISADLIYVRCTKTGYNGTENDSALKKLQKELEKIL